MNHYSSESRKNAGLKLEEQFAEQFSCINCDGNLVRSPRYWKSDLTCEDCGQQYEIKGSPRIHPNGKITFAVSAKAWENYDEDTLIIGNVTGTWVGRTDPAYSIEYGAAFLDGYKNWGRGR